MNRTKIGIDAGGTLIKMVYNENGHLHFKTFPAQDLVTVVHLLRAKLDTSELCLTGGKAAALKEELEFEPKEVTEFSATCRGAIHLLQEQKITASTRFILANVGTGTSFHLITEEGGKRIAGTGIGGGTFVGLSRLLTGEGDFDRLVQLSEMGDRASIDLSVKDIYGDVDSPIMGELTASNFGKLAESDIKNEDKIAAVAGMVAETIALLTSQLADAHGATSIVYIGTTFAGNPLLQGAVKKYNQLTQKTSFFLEHGEMSGAVGARLSLFDS